MDPLAAQLNADILSSQPAVLEMLSDLGRELYFPRGILSQTAEATAKAHRFNVTIGIAKEGKSAMQLNCVMKNYHGLTADQVLPYAPSPGLPVLRQKWQEQIFRKNPNLDGKSIGLPLVTNGITHGLSIAADMFVEPGDLMLVADMFWENYTLIFQLRRKAQFVSYPMFAAGGGLDLESFSATLAKHASRGKLIVSLNFPNNPSGYSPTNAEMQALCQTLIRTAEAGCRLVVLCDDAYFGLFYGDDVCTQSAFAFLADAHPNLLAVKLDGATKEDYVWGLRVGFLTFAIANGNDKLYGALDKKAGAAIRALISSGPLPSQSVVLQAMADPDYEIQRQQKVAILRERALKVKQVLADPRFAAVWEPYPFNSGYFMCLRLKKLDAEQFRLRLLNDYGIGTIATGQYDLRIAFSCIEVGDIAELFELMLQCATAMS